jgi:hypothetical protein
MPAPSDGQKLKASLRASVRKRATRRARRVQPVRVVNEAAFAAVQRVIELAEPPNDRVRQVMQRALERGKDPFAAALGHRGGLKGGGARMRNMTAAERRELALKAARARWDKRKGG